MGEEWRNIDGYRGYQISNRGNVKSFKGKKPRILKAGINGNGYYSVMLSCEGKQKSWTVHRLVALAFIDRHFGVNEVNHIDGDKLNNGVSNLEWVSHGDNMRHAVRTGLVRSFRMGQEHHKSKLTDEEVLYVFSIQGLQGQKELASLFGVSKSAVAHIQQERSWKHLTRLDKEQ